MVHSGTYITRTDFAQLAVVSAGGDEWHDYTNKEHAKFKPKHSSRASYQPMKILAGSQASSPGAAARRRGGQLKGKVRGRSWQDAGGRPRTSPGVLSMKSTLDFSARRARRNERAIS